MNVWHRIIIHFLFACLSLDNPFACEWLAEEIFESKNVNYGMDYVVKSRHDLFVATGIACIDRHTGIVQRLIVIEPKRDDVTVRTSWICRDEILSKCEWNMTSFCVLS